MRQSLKQTLRRAGLSALIGLTVNGAAFNSWADAVSNSASAAQEIGKSQISAFSASDSIKAIKQVFPDYGATNTSSLQAVFGSDQKTIAVGTDANSRLTTEVSTDGEAYRTLIKSNERVSVDLRQDPMFGVSDQVRSNDFMDGFKKNFSDCTKKDVFQDVKRDAHIAKYKTCERVNDLSGSFELRHDYSAGVIEYVSGQPNMQSCGDGCLYIWVGTVGDNYWSGQCSVYEEYTRFRVLARGAIISATIDQATFDDYMQIYLGDKMVWTHTPGIFPPETPGDCERGTSWNVTPNADVTYAFGNDSDVITFKTRTSVTNYGEGYARIKILYDPSKAYIDNGWYPKDKLAVFDAINDGFCPSHSVECNSSPTLDANGCMEQNGVKLCPSDVPPAPSSDISPFCRTANINADCSFYKGQMGCYVDPSGVQHCPTNDGGNLDSCAAFESDSSCGFVSQRCIDGAKGSSGTCYAFEEVWDCGYDASYQTAVNTGTQVDCPGGARCMGSECFDTSNKKSGDFAYAVAMLQVAQFAQADLACTSDGSDVTKANICTVFKGEGMECKKALGGYVDCCEAPEGVSIFDYVNLTIHTLKMASSIEAFNRTGSLFSPGYWAAAKEAVSAGANQLIKGEWGSVVDAAQASFSKTFGQDVALGVVQQQLMQWAYDAMVEMGAAAAADAVFATSAEGAVVGLAPAAAAAVSIIGWVYTAYVMTDLLIHIIWACEPKEFELGAKKETRQCSYVGSYCASKVLGQCIEKREAYCCFSSVVGRIIQEQGRQQLGMTFGDPKNPSCDGLTTDQLAKLDWSKIDLSEWIGMLNVTGHLPNINNVSLETRTGTGSELSQVFNAGETRENTLLRNQSRLDGVDADAIKRQAESELR